MNGAFPGFHEVLLGSWSLLSSSFRKTASVSAINGGGLSKGYPEPFRECDVAVAEVTDPNRERFIVLYLRHTIFGQDLGLVLNAPMWAYRNESGVGTGYRYRFESPCSKRDLFR